MEAAVVVALAIGMGYWAYQTGKRNGSRAAFRIGWRRGRSLRSRIG